MKAQNQNTLFCNTIYIQRFEIDLFVHGADAMKVMSWAVLFCNTRHAMRFQRDWCMVLNHSIPKLICLVLRRNAYHALSKGHGGIVLETLILKMICLVQPLHNMVCNTWNSKIVSRHVFLWRNRKPREPRSMRPFSWQICLRMKRARVTYKLWNVYHNRIFLE